MTLGPLTTRVIDLVIGLVGIIVILDHFGVNIGSLLVSLGVGSQAVALAVQDTRANTIAGFVILVDCSFRVGDRVELESRKVGDVKEIGPRSTRVMNFDNNMIIIPNSELVKGHIINYSHPYAAMRVVLRFDFAYGTESNMVRVLLLEVAKAQPAALKDPEPKVFVTAVTNSALQVMLVMRYVSFTEQYAVEATFREQAYRAFCERGIAMTIPQWIVQMEGEA